MVMRTLLDNFDFTPCKLVKKLTISLGGLNYCLKALIEKGLLKIKNFAISKNKIGYLVVLALSGMAYKAAIAHNFLQRKIEKCEAFRSQVDMPEGEGTQKA